MSKTNEAPVAVTFREAHAVRELGLRLEVSENFPCPINGKNRDAVRGKTGRSISEKQGAQFRCRRLLLWPPRPRSLVSPEGGGWSPPCASPGGRLSPTPRGLPRGLPRGPHICGEASPWKVTRDCLQMLWEDLRTSGQEAKDQDKLLKIHSHPEITGQHVPVRRPTSAPGLAGSSGRQRAIAEAGEALSSSRRPDVAIVTVHQNLPERLTLRSNRITKSASGFHA